MSAKARDLQRVAHHEAGHFRVAWHFALEQEIRIWAHGPNSYYGFCTFGSAANPAVNQAIHLAGGAAEALWLHGVDATDDIVLPAARRRLSASDVAGAGSFGRYELYVAANLCRRFWPEIKACAAEQISIVTQRERVVASLSRFEHSPRLKALA